MSIIFTQVLPEPPLDPPEDFYVEADCGHEVYLGESLFEWEGKYICPDCFREAIDDLSLEELAAMLNLYFTPVTKPKPPKRVRAKWRA